MKVNYFLVLAGIVFYLGTAHAESTTVRPVETNDYPTTGRSVNTSPSAGRTVNSSPVLASKESFINLDGTLRNRVTGTTLAK